MIFSYCYIDYTKKDSEKLSIRKTDSAESEILISTKYADIYFSINCNHTSIKLKQDSNFVLLLVGSIESQDISLNTLLLELKRVGVKEVLKRVNGVFSLIVYDKNSNKLYFSRDHFGIVSAYYYQNENSVLFSNRLQSFKGCSLFKKRIDFDTLGQYLQHGYIQQPHTIFKDCYKVRSAHFMVFDLKTRNTQEVKYWDLVDFYNMPRVDMSEDEILQKCEELLKCSIKSNVGGSKKVASFLSGGNDSSMIVAILSCELDLKPHTFTMGFYDKEIDEAPFAKKVAEHLGIKHTEKYFNVEYFKELLKQLPSVYDEPLADKAALPTIIITREASCNGAEIIFGGEGGDEIFASSSFLKKFNQLNFMPYPIRFILSKAFKLLPKSAKNLKYSKMLQERNVEDILKYKDITLTYEGVKKLLKVKTDERTMNFSNFSINPSSHHFDRIFPFILKSYVSDNLLNKISFAANSYNLVPKEPYLDKKFVEFLAQVDFNIKHKNNTNKYILKKILQKYIPTGLIKRPKKGFSVHIGEMLKNELRDELDYYLDVSRLEAEGIFDPYEVLKLKKRFLKSNSYQDEQNIWNILVFELWYEHWFNQ